MTGRARTVFLGSGEFAIPIVERLAASPQAELTALVSAPARPRGRRGELQHAPVGRWAADRGLPLLSPERLRDPAPLAAIAELEPALIVLADYGQIVPPALLALPEHGALNLHPSLLPRHRGASPVPAAILAGDDQTGVSLMLMDAGLDTGPLVAQRSLALTGAETSPKLEARLAVLAAELLDDSLAGWLSGELDANPQPAEGATLTRPLRREDGRLDPAKPAEVLERQVRAYQPWPGSFLETSAGRLLVWQASALPQAEGSTAGTLVGWTGDSRPTRLGLVTGDGLLELIEVQLAGARRMSADELLRGRPQLARELPADVSARWR